MLPGTVTVRLPDDTHKRIKELAASRKTSINKLYEEFTIMALTGFDAENRFKAMAGTGKKERGLELLKKLKTHYDD
ncbi:MAG: toxin-antitoxin system HicB family antitoxin [Candidatus Electrothrix sp. AR1]|nr:toxin-antitoxin system HicB family antitoxin [Candidatus Electrothrix sp. AR1]